MAVENVTYLNSLNPTNPGPLDSVSEGDDHIRNIKQALVSSFPLVDGEVPLKTQDFVQLKDWVDNGVDYDDQELRQLIQDNTDKLDLIKEKSEEVAEKRFAAVTYNGSGKVGTAHNVGTIEWRDQGNGWRFAYIPFETGLDGSANPDASGGGAQGGNGILDANLNIQVTAFSNDTNSMNAAGFAYAVITEITNFHCEVAFVQADDQLIFQPVWNQAFCLSITRND